MGELFEKEMGTEKGNFDPTYLTHAARKNLRHLFLNAEAAMTGANFAVASTGDIVVCTNEGNADMGTSYPKLNIAAFGMEKICSVSPYSTTSPNRKNAVLSEILAACCILCVTMTIV